MTTVPQPSSPLLRRNGDGQMEMMCPGCGGWNDILAYKFPDVVKRYMTSLNIVAKCPNRKCRHIFSPKWLNSEDKDG